MASCAEKTSSKASRSRAFGHSARSAADCGRCRMCSACQNEKPFSDSKSEASSHSGKSGSLRKGFGHNAVQEFLREAQRQGIDRLDRRQLRTVGGGEDVIGMGHLKARAVALHAARHDRSSLSGKRRRMRPVAVEKHDVERCALVLANHTQRSPRPAFRQEMGEWASRRGSIRPQERHRGWRASASGRDTRSGDAKEDRLPEARSRASQEPSQATPRLEGRALQALSRGRRSR